MSSSTFELGFVTTVHKSAIQMELHPACASPPPPPTILTEMHFSFCLCFPPEKKNGADGPPLDNDLNPETRKNLIDYWNGDMNGLYKMPPVVGGRGAQRDEVFSAIHLPLHCFVLWRGKTALTTASFDASKISCTGSHPFTSCGQKPETWVSLTAPKES